MEVKYYIAINESERQGPYSVEELKEHITPETKVWNNNLPNWVMAKDLKELKHLFIDSTQEQNNQPKSRFNPPKSWLLSSLITFFVFSFLFGAIAVYFASKVDDNYILGAVEQSKEHAKKARLFVFLGIAIGILYRPILLSSLFGLL